MRVHVEFLAVLSEWVGIKSEWTEVAEGTTVEQLWRTYVVVHPRAARVRAVYAVNQQRVDADYVLRDGDHVRFLPPLGGGMMLLE